MALFILSYGHFQFYGFGLVIKIFGPLVFIYLVVRFRSSDRISLFQIHSKKMILLFGEELADPILTEKIKVRPIKVRPIKVTISLKMTSSIPSIENFDPLAIGIPRKFFPGVFQWAIINDVTQTFLFSEALCPPK